MDVTRILPACNKNRCEFYGTKKEKSKRRRDGRGGTDDSEELQVGRPFWPSLLIGA